LRIAGLAIVLVGVMFGLAMLFLHAYLKRSIVAILQDRFQSEVQINNLQTAIFPRVSATADDITLHLKGSGDAPPMITIRRLTVSANIVALMVGHISSVHLEGLQIRIPPHPPSTGQGIKRGKRIRFPLVIDQITSDDALLETLPSDAKHVAHDFDIHHVVLGSFSFDSPASFSATLTNPVPKGEIESQGRFGPWVAEQPGETAVSGKFVFSNADFSSIHGLSGTMSSEGKYSGTLDKINVEGDTKMSDFALAFAGNPMPLTTHYVAVVDGTTGNTYLQSVEAHLGQSPISVKGEIVGVPGMKGRHVMLEATSRGGRAQDLLHLAVKGPPPVDGTMDLHTTIDLPPAPGGGNDVVGSLSLDGAMDIASGHFTNSGVQTKLDSLSRAGRGEPKDSEIQDVISNMQAKFVVGHGVAHLSGVSFEVPGATVQMDGSYGMQSGDIDFHGHLILDAKLSQTTTGIKSDILKLFDPLFKKPGGGSSIPIAVTGNRTHPMIGPDFSGKSRANSKQQSMARP